MPSPQDELRQRPFAPRRFQDCLLARTLFPHTPESGPQPPRQICPQLSRRNPPDLLYHSKTNGKPYANPASQPKPPQCPTPRPFSRSGITVKIRKSLVGL